MDAEPDEEPALNTKGVVEESEPSPGDSSAKDAAALRTGGASDGEEAASGGDTGCASKREGTVPVGETSPVFFLFIFSYEEERHMSIPRHCRL